MAITIQAPQTNTGDLRALYNYQYALNELINNDPIQKGLFGENAIFGKNGYLNTLSDNMIASNNLQAQDYFNNLSLDEITRAKNEGRDLLKEYANGRYFFNPDDENVRQARADRNTAEKAHIATLAGNEAVRRAMDNRLRGGSAEDIYETLNAKNRSVEEQDALNATVQQTLKDRYLDHLRGQAASLGLGGTEVDPLTGKTYSGQEQQVDYVTDFAKHFGMDINPTDVLKPENLKSFETHIADRQIAKLLEEAAKAGNVEDINKLRQDAAKYRPYATNYDQLVSTLDDSMGKFISTAYNDTFNDPSIEKYIKDNNLTADEAQQVRFDAVRKKTGVTPSQLYSFLTGENATAQQYNDSRTDTITRKAEVAQAKASLEEGIKSLDEAYPSTKLGTYLFNGGTPNLDEKLKLEDSDFSRIKTAVETDQDSLDALRNISRVTKINRTVLLKNLSRAYIQEKYGGSPSQFADALSSNRELDFKAFLRNISDQANVKENYKTKERDYQIWADTSRKYFGRLGRSER